jgi:hypothetical protein
LEDRLGALEGESQHEGGVRVSPGRDQKRHGPAALREIDVDVAEIGFEAPAREMSQRDEGFRLSRPASSHAALHLGVPAVVAMLVAEAAKDLGSGMPLLGGCGFVIAEDLIDDRLERPELGGGTVPGQRLGMRVGMDKGMPDGFSGVSELAGDLSDGHAIAPSPADCAIVVHGHHVLGLRVDDRSPKERSP